MPILADFKIKIKKMVFEDDEQSKKTLNDLDPSTWNSLVLLLEKSPDQEWERIGKEKKTSSFFISYAIKKMN